MHLNMPKRPTIFGTEGVLKDMERGVSTVPIEEVLMHVVIFGSNSRDHWC